MSEIKTEFGSWLQKQREDNGLTLEELGERASTSHSTISRYENGKGGQPRDETVKRIARALSPDGDDRYIDQAFEARNRDLHGGKKPLAYVHTPDELALLEAFAALPIFAQKAAIAGVQAAADYFSQLEESAFLTAGNIFVPTETNFGRDSKGRIIVADGKLLAELDRANSRESRTISQSRESVVKPLIEESTG